MEEGTIIASIIVGVPLAGIAVWEYYRFKNRLKDILREHLTDPRWNWRTFEGLKRAIHADDNTTTQLLFEIGARPNEKEKDVWMLD